MGLLSRPSLLNYLNNKLMRSARFVHQNPTIFSMRSHPLIFCHESRRSLASLARVGRRGSGRIPQDQIAVHADVRERDAARAAIAR